MNSVIFKLTCACLFVASGPTATAQLGNAPPGWAPYPGLLGTGGPNSTAAQTRPPGAGFPNRNLPAGPIANSPGLPPAGPPSQDFEAAQILARVGDEVILAGEVTGTVDAILEQNKDRVPPEQWDKQRRLLIQQALKGIIEAKLVLVDAKRTIPAERLPDIESQVNDHFEKDHINRLMKATEAGSRAELEAKLVEAGSSIAQQKQKYLERSLVGQWLRQQTQFRGTISHDEMYRYYQEHLTDYEHSAKVRWEQLSVKIAKHPSKAAAYAKLATMGNDVMLRNMPFADVARGRSDGITAAQGGRRDWTTRNALKSRVLDETIFTLPVGQMSRILEDEDAFHIIRVIERVDAHRTQFRDAQVEIRKKIEDQRRKEAQKEYYARLRKETRVWTVFDDPAVTQRVLPGGSRTQ